MQEVWTDPKIPGEYRQGIGFRLCRRDRYTEENGSCPGKAEFGEDISGRWYQWTPSFALHWQYASQASEQKGVVSEATRGAAAIL